MNELRASVARFLPLLFPLLSSALVAAPARADAPLTDAAVWHRVDAEGDAESAPSARAGHAMAYDAARSRGLLFGGHGDAAESLGDTWEIDGVRWARVATSTSSAPPAREGHALAYDARRGRVLLFGGRTCDASGLCTPRNDAWVHDANGWRELTTRASSAMPSPRYDVAMAFDDDRGVLVVNGGRSCASDACAIDETWELDGDTWALRSSRPVRAGAPHDVLAGAGQTPVLVFDAAMGHVVAFAADPAGVRAPFVAAWDGSAWADMEAPAFAIPALTSLVGAFDTSRGRVVLLGDAFVAGAWGAHTAEWDGVTWRERARSAAEPEGPARRVGAAMFFDRARARAVTFGGRAVGVDGAASGESAGNAEGATGLLRDTWEYDGGRLVANDPAIDGSAADGGTSDAAADAAPAYAKGVEPADFSAMKTSPVWFGNPHAGDCGCRTAVGSGASSTDGRAASIAFIVTLAVVLVRRRRAARRELCLSAGVHIR